MPGYNDSRRLKADDERARSLVDEARTLVNTRWSGQSWSELGYSVVSSGAEKVKWALGIGLKIAINTASGGVFGAVGTQILDRAGSAGYGPESLAQSIAGPVVEKFWPVIEDVIKGAAESAALGLGENLVGPSGRVQRRSKTTQSNKNIADIDEALASLKAKAAELMLRSYALRESLNKGSVPYCDNVHYMSVELAQVAQLRTDVMAAAHDIQGYALQLEKLAKGIDPVRLEADVRKLAKAAVKKTSGVPHYNSYSWNVVGRSQQCSEVHCWGPHTTQL